MSDHLLYLTEIFESIQGETSLTGWPTTFIRLAACNLRCTWCDTSYSFGKGTPHTISEIISKVQTLGSLFICITGGEPLLQSPVHFLIKSLADLGYTISLETSGSISTKEVDPRVRIILDIKCPGSGMSHKNIMGNLDLLRTHDEVKFVLADRCDYEYAKDVVKNMGLIPKVHSVLFAPAFGILDPKTLISWMLEDKLKVRLNMQVHKWIWSPETRGV